VVIDVRTEPPVLPDHDLEGLTFYVADPLRARVRLNGTEVAGLVRNGPDHLGRRSISLPRRRLAFPPL